MASSQRDDGAAEAAVGPMGVVMVLRDDGTRTDDGVVTNGHAGADDYPATEPVVVADVDRRSRLPLVPAQPRLKRVRGCQELNIGADLDVVADRDRSHVKNDQPKCLSWGFCGSIIEQIG
jgi:hypothetical protein